MSASGSAMLGRRAVIAGVAMAGASAAAGFYMPRRSSAPAAGFSIDKLLPNQLGEWSFTTRQGVVNTQEVGPIEGYDQVVTRVYVGAGLPRIMLLIAYGSVQGGSLQLHRPETCYPGEGFRIGQMAATELVLPNAAPITARTFTATRDTRVERLIYWTRIGNSFPLNTFGEYRAILDRVSHGVMPDGILVRLSTIGSEQASADEALARFAQLMTKAAPEPLRSVLVGPQRAREIERAA